VAGGRWDDAHFGHSLVLFVLVPFVFGENFLFDIGLKSASLFDTLKIFLPILTCKLRFFPKMTLQCILSTDGVKQEHEKTILPLMKIVTEKFVPTSAGSFARVLVVLTKKSPLL
jgi:hypothetical protein